jgi:hypothetical protein
VATPLNPSCCARLRRVAETRLCDNSYFVGRVASQGASAPPRASSRAPFACNEVMFQSCFAGNRLSIITCTSSVSCCFVEFDHALLPPLADLALRIRPRGEQLLFREVVTRRPRYLDQSQLVDTITSYRQRISDYPRPWPPVIGALSRSPFDCISGTSYRLCAKAQSLPTRPDDDP